MKDYKVMKNQNEYLKRQLTSAMKTKRTYFHNSPSSKSSDLPTKKKKRKVTFYYLKWGRTYVDKKKPKSQIHPQDFKVKILEYKGR